jgi:AraC-like DNA-binding protein
LAITVFDQAIPLVNPISASGTVAMRSLDRIIRGATKLGANRADILTFLGIREANLRNPLGRISIIVPMRLIIMLESQLSDPAIAIRIAFADTASDFSDPEFAFRYLPNLYETISGFIAEQAGRQNVAPVSIVRGSASHILTWQVEPDQSEILARFIEFSAAFYLRLSRNVLGEPASIREVHFMHKPRFEPEIYAELFGVVPQFSMPQSHVHLNARQLFRPSLLAIPSLTTAAMAMHSYPQSLLASGYKMRGSAYFYTSSQLPYSPVTLENMAETYAMSPRTLRRKLVEEGQSFRSLLDEVRRDHARLYHLEGRRTIGEIAALLGYSEVSAFSRSHKRWTGHAPTQVK